MPMQRSTHRCGTRLVSRLRQSGTMRYAPVLAGLVFGAWAAFVNSDYGILVLVRTGLGQGIYALFSTWIVMSTVTAVMHRMSGSALRLPASFVAGVIVMVSIPLAIHSILGTPEIWLAIAPGILWGCVFIAGVIWVS